MDTTVKSKETVKKAIKPAKKSISAEISTKKAVKKVSKKKPIKKKPVKKLSVKKKPMAVAIKKPAKHLPVENQARPPREKLVLPQKFQVNPKSVVVVYGMRIDERKILNSAVEAYNKRRYTVHDIKLSDYNVHDPKFKNLMVKIAVLDRIEEEILRIYPRSDVKRPNTVTLLID